jgi:hypothetical protein
MKQPHFYYEFDESQSHKMSTEDVTCTRDAALFWKMTTGEDVLFANCDAWALHVKTKHVGRPTFTPIETVGKDFAEAIRQNWSGNDRLRFLKRDVPRASDAVVLGKDQEQIIVSDDFIAQRMREDAEREAEKSDPIVENTLAIQSVVDEALDNDQPHKSNGIFRRQRKIGARLVTTLGREIPDQAIEHIQRLGEWCVAQRAALPMDVGVVHSDTGQAAAAILHSLPEGSHLFCLDNLGSREHGADKATAFSEAFTAELETGRVMADIVGRNFPVPQQPAELDMVFIERFVTGDWLEIWKRHLKPDGVLAGYAGTPGEQEAVRSFAEQQGLIVQFNDGVFAVPLTIEEYA